MSLSNEELRQRLAKQEWTGHNIRLNADISTMPGTPDFMETDLRLKAILRALGFFYRGQLAGLRVADLGCLEVMAGDDPHTFIQTLGDVGRRGAFQEGEPVLAAGREDLGAGSFHLGRVGPALQASVAQRQAQISRAQLGES